jgi:hypothetical protein
MMRKAVSTALGICLCTALSFSAERTCLNAVDYADPAYGGRVRQLLKADGHEHNLYYDRNPWNADASRMLGVQSNLEQKNWRVVLYDGDGCFIRELFGIDRYDWRLAWDRRDPDTLYTWRGSNLYSFSVTAGSAKLLKSFAPMGLNPNGPSLNQSGDRILVVTSDKVFHSYRLPDMSEERSFAPELPAGCGVSWDKPRYIGYKNYLFVSCNTADMSEVHTYIYEDSGRLLHRFDGISAGHTDFSPDGKWAYFKMSGISRGVAAPLEIHVVNIDGTDDRTLLSIPQREARYVQNLHLAWPSRGGPWFIASFFPSADNLPASYAPPLDEMVLIRLDGTRTFLARTGTAYASAGRRSGSSQDTFWAQPLARPSADGRRISFNSNRSGTIDQFVLSVDDGQINPAPGAKDAVPPAPRQQP